MDGRELDRIAPTANESEGGLEMTFGGSTVAIPFGELAQVVVNVCLQRAVTLTRRGQQSQCTLRGAPGVVVERPIREEDGELEDSRELHLHSGRCYYRRVPVRRLLP